jgi:hypothetical protein
VQDVEAHALDRVRTTALDQLAKGEPGRATVDDVAADAAIRTEAPAATSAVAEPPPPRGNRPGEAAGAEAPDPALVEAERIVPKDPTSRLRPGPTQKAKPSR